MNFFFLTPLAPRTRVPLFGGGVKTSLRILGAVCGFGPRSRAFFFLYMDPLADGRGPGSELQVPPVAPPYGPVLVRTSPFSRWIVIPARFPKFAFFRNASVAPRMVLGDALVTIRVIEHPGGPTLWPLGLCSPCHGPRISFKIAVCRWLNGIWCAHKLFKQLSTLVKSKIENFAKHFFDIVTIYDDEICYDMKYVKHVLALFNVFFTL